MNTASARPKTPRGVVDSTFCVGSVEELGVNPETVRAFLRTSWKQETVLSLQPFYDWQFRSLPEGEGKDHCLVVADEEGGVHGFMGVNLHTFNLRGQALRGAELTTWIHAEEARGSYAVEVLKTLQRSYDVVVGAGISDEALPVYTGMGFRIVSHLPRYVRIFNWRPLCACSRISPLGRRLIAQRDLGTPVAYRAHRASLYDLDDVVAEVHAHFNGYSRDARYLQWRYADHPFFRYHIFRVEGPGTTAGVILRLDEAPGFRFVHVIDVLGPAAAIPAVVSFVEGFSREHDAAFADLTCTSIRMAHPFWYRGWFSVLDDAAVGVPHLFHPIEFRDPPTTSLTLWARDHLEALLDLSRLYVTKGDCDLDRPTMVFLRQHPVQHVGGTA